MTIELLRAAKRVADFVRKLDEEQLDVSAAFDEGIVEVRDDITLIVELAEEETEVELTDDGREHLEARRG